MHLRSKEDGYPVFNKIMSHQSFQKYFENASMRRKTKSNNKLELRKYVFEIWNQYSQDGYVSGSHRTVD